MSFNDDVQIDTSRVDTSSSGGGFGGGLGGQGMGGGGLGGGPVMVGGGMTGLVVTVLIVLWQVFANQGMGGTSVSSGNGGSDMSNCKTGIDANRDSNCRMAATANSLAAFWQAQPQVSKYFSDINKLHLYSGSTSSRCGTASNQVGPFYCPLDKSIYIDTSFFQVMQRELGASDGPLAEEYVLAHEYGHHLQGELRVLDEAQQDPKGANSGAVRIELMADCFAGMWMKNAQQTKDANGVPYLKPFTDAQILDAVGAAKSVGDDAIQGRNGGVVTPERWTHGSSAQRVKWLQTGMGTDDVNACNTLQAGSLS